MTEFEKLLEIISPKTAGIIWVTDTPLNKRPSPFHVLNYLFNNLLSQAKSSSSTSLLFSHNFNRPIFLYQTSTDNQIWDIDKIVKIESSDEIILIGMNLPDIDVNYILKTW